MATIRALLIPVLLLVLATPQLRADYSEVPTPSIFVESVPNSEPTVPTGFCGDGIIQAALGESCDDGNNVDEDGCSSDCVDETLAGYCGDGVRNIGEGCDDGNATDGDGCDSNCNVEPIATPTPACISAGVSCSMVPGPVAPGERECCEELGCHASAADITRGTCQPSTHTEVPECTDPNQVVCTASDGEGGVFNVCCANGYQCTTNGCESDEEACCTSTPHACNEGQTGCYGFGGYVQCCDQDTVCGQDPQTLRAVCLNNVPQGCTPPNATEPDPDLFNCSGACCGSGATCITDPDPTRNDEAGTCCPLGTYWWPSFISEDGTLVRPGECVSIDEKICGRATYNDTTHHCCYLEVPIPNDPEHVNVAEWVCPRDYLCDNTPGSCAAPPPPPIPYPTG